MNEAAPQALRQLARPARQPANWRDLALCIEVDPEIFFPEKGESVIPAKRVCAACEVRAECLQYALDHGERYGVWGGLSERERRALAHQPSPSRYCPVCCAALKMPMRAAFTMPMKNRAIQAVS